MREKTQNQTLMHSLRAFKGRVDVGALVFTEGMVLEGRHRGSSSVLHTFTTVLASKK